MKDTPIHQRPYQAAKNRDASIDFVTRAVEAVFGLPGLPGKVQLMKKLFWTAAWLVSEVDGKYGTRYRTQAALEAPGDQVEHEHVFPISLLWFVVRRALPVHEALRFSCGCVVTKAEHQTLTRLEKSEDTPMGWMRYSALTIPVVDMVTDQIVSSAEMETWSKPFEKAFRDSRFIDDGQEWLDELKESDSSK